MASRRLTRLVLSLVIAGALFGQLACTGDKTESPAPTPSPSVSPSPTASPDSTIGAGTGAAGAGIESAIGGGGAVGSAAGSTSSGGSSVASSGGPSTALPPPTAVVTRSATPTPTPRPPRTYTIRPGTQLTVYTARELSTKTNKAGDTFVGSLGNAITDGDWVVAKRGAQVSGVITRADDGGRVKDVASMTVELKRLTLADGRTINLDTTAYTRQARSTKKKDATKIGIGAGIGAAIGAIAGGGKGAAIGAGVGGGAGTGVVLATKGEPAVIPGEASITFRVTSPVTVTKQQ